MENNPYAPPSAKTPSNLLKDLPKEERRRRILAGETPAGVLLVGFYKHPIRTAIISLITLGGIVRACWALVQM